MVIAHGDKILKIRDKNDMRIMLCYGVSWLINPYKGLTCAELISKVGLFYQGQQAPEWGGSYDTGSAGFSTRFFQESMKTEEDQEDGNRKTTEGEKMAAAAPRGAR